MRSFMHVVVLRQYVYLKRHFNDDLVLKLTHATLSLAIIHSFRSLSDARSTASPKRVLNWMRSSASSSSIQYTPSALRSFNNCLRPLPCPPVTFILPSIFPSVKCFRKQFLRKIWPIQLAFLLFIVPVCRTS